MSYSGDEFVELRKPIEIFGPHLWARSPSGVSKAPMWLVDVAQRDLVPEACNSPFRHHFRAKRSKSISWQIQVGDKIILTVAMQQLIRLPRLNNR